jgi:hypothetical protein
MKPIRFAVEETLASDPARVVAQILDLASWPKFRGFGPIPGIQAAEFIVRRPDVVGTRIRVVSLDGSSHIEEIVEFERDRQLRLRMHDFSLPVSRVALQFHETWEFVPSEGQTKVTRSFELYPRSNWARPMLWIISLFLRRAIRRNLREMKRDV